MKFLFLTLFMISTSSWANNPNACDSATELGTKRCIEEVLITVKEAGVPPVACASTLDKDNPACPPLAEEFNDKSAECDKFISTSKSGGYGPWGREIVGYLEAKGDDSIFYSNDLNGMSSGVKACPNWEKMNKDEKQHFWVWVMASIAHIESTCDPKARNGQATNGAAIGLLQLDERASARKWRGPNCGVKSVSNPKENLRCGLDILEELLKGKQGEYKSNGEIWGRGSSSYWQHLKKKDGGEISDLIQLNPFCKG
ncbi:hypothetical protein C0V70_12530 [Bacteriovorax stolpii]|uniref:Uncharacterized protein n=1 Tax=Bacteriovorax stolpii TaxID=960 RepID=A0A2K9NTT8_BACTC|nr:transglycosylase SLT domain-containing protein [Bacteriovorax stolpii]AUN98912.1 hypothetical protein C0V70_12530 [Bacteriovorax stolpii]TDP55563.1 transglycosylase-like protein with SLT domain [Bacteriovorax stolpii]